MQQILLVFQVLLAAGLIGLVLIQQGRGADAGASFGGGSSGSLFGSRGPASFLAKITALLAAVFFINSIGLAYLASQARSGQSSVVEVLDTQTESVLPPLPENSTAVADDIPTAPDSESAATASGTDTAADVPAEPESSTKTQ